MNLIDTHFHLDLWSNPKEIIKQIEDKKIYTIAVTNAPSVFKLTYQLTDGLKYIRPALGYHPEVINNRPNDLPLFKEYLNLTKYIGEIGLDYACKVDKNIQRKVFTSIINDCFEIGNKILTIHSRRAENDCIDTIGSNPKSKIIFHWYSGSLKSLEIGLKNGYFFSINYAMTLSENGKKIISKIPIERMLTESDGPFVNINNEKANPLLIPQTIKNLAKLMNIDSDVLSQNIYNNFTKMLKY